MGYKFAYGPIYGYMKGYKNTIPLHLVHYARTFSIFKLLNTLNLGKVLNVGGADGSQSNLIKTLFGADVTTVDINSEALKIAEEDYGLKTKIGSANNLPFEDNAFDTIVCIETIEHVEGSEAVVSELMRVARKNVIISTESFFDSEEQKQDFLLYIRETHPQFSRKENPEPRGDVSYFTLEDFTRLLGTDEYSIYPQFSSKQIEILGDIEEIRAHVKGMTENLEVNRCTKIIVHHTEGEPELNPSPLPERTILETIVTEGPLFPLELDDEMIAEDQDFLQRITRWHEEKLVCKVTDAASVPALPIEEEGAEGMTMQWLIGDDVERSPSFSTRKVTLQPGGVTPRRQTSWEHQLHILSGSALLVEDSLETPLGPGNTVQVRPNLAFTIKNIGETPLEYLHIIPSVTSYFGR